MTTYISSKCFGVQKSLSIICVSILSLVNSLRPGDADMPHWSVSSPAHVMACCLFNTKPLPESMLTYCHLLSELSRSSRVSGWSTMSIVHDDGDTAGFTGDEVGGAGSWLEVTGVEGIITVAGLRTCPHGIQPARMVPLPFRFQMGLQGPHRRDALQVTERWLVAMTLSFSSPDRH